MNKIDLIVALAAKKNLTEKQATDIVDLVFDGFTDTLKNGGRIEIRGFGSFTVRKYKAYKGRNPRTGDAVECKTEEIAVFQGGKGIKEDAWIVDKKLVGLILITSCYFAFLFSPVYATFQTTIFYLFLKKRLFPEINFTLTFHSNRSIY